MTHYRQPPQRLENVRRSIFLCADVCKNQYIITLQSHFNRQKFIYLFLRAIHNFNFTKNITEPQ